MNKTILMPSLFFLILGSTFYSSFRGQVPATTLVLYDAFSGEVPDKSLMGFTDFPPGTASVSYLDNATVFDTTLSGADAFAGWVASQATTSGFPVLDRISGISVRFLMQVEKETHSNSNRAGFSVILLDQEAMGIELSFWENEIWAQHDERSGDLFHHGEGAAFSTTSLTEYQLMIIGDTYTLTANNVTILTGPVRDYSSFEGFPDPYQTPNFLFLGDDTTSAQAHVRLQYLSITGVEPVIPTMAITSTNTSIPTPTASFTPIPSATTISSPMPASKPSSPLCPSGWLLAMVANGLLWKKIRRGVIH